MSRIAQLSRTKSFLNLSEKLRAKCQKFTSFRMAKAHFWRGESLVCVKTSVKSLRMMKNFYISLS